MPLGQDWLLLRVTVYDFLRCLFLFGPKSDLLSSLGRIASYQYADELIKLGAAVDGSLEEEHTRLFTNPTTMAAPPFASYYLSSGKLLMQETTSSVERLYLELGYSLSDRSLSEDQIGVEFEFMYMLALKTFKSVSRADEKLLRNLVEKQIDFLESHMQKWIPPFCSRMAGASRTGSFYHRLAGLLEAFTRDDATSLKSLLKQP